MKITVGLDVRVRGFVSWRARSNLRAAITASSLRRATQLNRTAIRIRRISCVAVGQAGSRQTLIVSNTVTVLISELGKESKIVIETKYSLSLQWK